MKLAWIFGVAVAGCAAVYGATGTPSGDRLGVTTLFVVRHAEKTSESSDAQLSEEGRARAETLAWMLRDVSFDAVYSTNLARTRNTVAAVAKAAGTKLSFYSPKPGLLKKQLETEHVGHTVLISGHSNTIPAFLKELGVPIQDRILPGFDDLFLVTLDPAQRATIQRLHYPGTR